MPQMLNLYPEMHVNELSPTTERKGRELMQAPSSAPGSKGRPCLFALTAILMLTLAIMLLAGCSRATPAITDDPPEVDPPPAPPELSSAFMVMIDNHSRARPQHGLSQADVVYEFICEAGITRFLAAFYTHDPGFVGPVRSIRYYYLQMARAYDLPLAHVGGSMNALEMRGTLGIKSICDITNASGAFFVDKTRSRPHSTYITSESLLGVAAKRSYAAKGLPELPLGDFPATQVATEVQITYSSSYNVAWVYQAEEQHYQRLVNGEPHPTAEEEEIVAQNIIIIEAPVKTVEVPINGVQSQINVLGEGKALFLRNGQLASGTWHKDKPESHFHYRLDDGSELNYAEGNVWIQQAISLSKHVVTK